MKTLVIEINTPTPGDLCIVEYADPRGGKTSAKHRVRPHRLRPVLDEHGNPVTSEVIPADTAIDVVNALIADINQWWLPDAFTAKLKENTGSLVVNCADVVAHVIFSVEVAGDGGTVMTLEEF